MSFHSFFCRFRRFSHLKSVITATSTSVIASYSVISFDLIEEETHRKSEKIFAKYEEENPYSFEYLNEIRDKIFAVRRQSQVAILLEKRQIPQTPLILKFFWQLFYTFKVSYDQKFFTYLDINNYHSQRNDPLLEECEKERALSSLIIKKCGLNIKRMVGYISINDQSFISAEEQKCGNVCSFEQKSMLIRKCIQNARHIMHSKGRKATSFIFLKLDKNSMPTIIKDIANEEHFQEFEEIESEKYLMKCILDNWEFTQYENVLKYISWKMFLKLFALGYHLCFIKHKFHSYLFLQISDEFYLQYLSKNEKNPICEQFHQFLQLLEALNMHSRLNIIFIVENEGLKGIQGRTRLTKDGQPLFIFPDLVNFCD